MSSHGTRVAPRSYHTFEDIAVDRGWIALQREFDEQTSLAAGLPSLPALSVQREALIKKGLIYASKHGTVDYTVPRFADYLHRRESSDR